MPTAQRSESYRAPRGTRDLLPEDLVLIHHLERTARRLAASFHYAEIRPPLLEETRLFARSLGETSDVVEKEMFTVPRRGDVGRSGTESAESSPAPGGYTFRPEGTAGVARAYIEGGFAMRAPLQKWYYIGPMFRYERPQKGRERQFTQFGVEVFGASSPHLDAEVVLLALRFFTELGFGKDLEVRINTMGDPADRDRWRAALQDYFQPLLSQRCADCRRRYERNVFRLLDCKVEACQETNAKAPRLREFLAEESAGHFAEVRNALTSLGCRVVEDPGIVRGLDYYTRTVFEVHYPPLGARSALCGGGRYDGLVESMGGPAVAGVGFAIGFTPTELALKQLGLPPTEALADLRAALNPAVYCVAIGAEDRLSTLGLASQLRAAGLTSVTLDYREKSSKAQFKEAGKMQARFVCVIGSEERAAQTVVVKDMAAGNQESVPLSEVSAYLRTQLKESDLPA